jgi:hypothetical protein
LFHTWRLRVCRTPGTRCWRCPASWPGVWWSSSSCRSLRHLSAALLCLVV